MSRYVYITIKEGEYRGYKYRIDHYPNYFPDFSYRARIFHDTAGQLNSFSLEVSAIEWIHNWVDEYENRKPALALKDESILNWLESA